MKPRAMRLRRMALCGLALLVAAARAAEPTDTAVELPPLIVEEATNLPPWLYVQAGDTEYLSRCSESTTRHYVNMRRARTAWLHALFPPEFFVRRDVPVVTVLVSQKLKPSNNAEVIGDVLSTQSRRGAGFSGARFVPNLLLTDADSIGVFAYIDENSFRPDELTISSDYVRLLLETRIPALPSWLIEGIVNTYDDIDFTARAITLRPLVWLNPADTMRLALNPEAWRTLLPARELFGLSAARSNEHAKLARAERRLLFRWALDPRNAVREKFWAYARRALTEPAGEELFTECFGFGFAELRDRLSDYLPLAVRGPLELSPGEFPREGRPEIRRAAPSEIARLRGEWERLALQLVRRRHPDLAGRYLAQAQHTLERAAEAGERDPRFLATRALCAIDAGDDLSARESLELAAAAKVVRPRVYYELARVRWAALNASAGASRDFSYAEIAAVLEPLRECFKQSPALVEATDLFADVWRRCAAAPDATDLQHLVTGGRLWISAPRTCLRVAVALGRHGRIAEATAELSEGFRFAADDATRAQFAQLFSALQRAAKKSGPEK